VVLILSGARAMANFAPDPEEFVVLVKIIGNG